MNITIHNIRSIRKAELSLGGITLVAGKNLAGKTTILNSVACALTGERNMYGATATDCSSVLSTGAETASVSVSGKDWQSGLLWPRYEAIGNGNPPPFSAITLGRISPAEDLDPKKWSTFLSKISGAAEVNADTIRGKLRKIETSERADAAEQRIMATLKSGWRAGESLAEENRTQARRTWEGITGQRFGSSKSANWVAEGYRATDDEDELVKRIGEIQEAARRADVKADLVDIDLDDLRREIKLNTERSQIAGKATQEAQERANEIVAELKKFPDASLSCPECGCSVALIDGKLEKLSPDLEVGGEYHESLKHDHQGIQTRLTQLLKERGTLVAKIEADTALAKRLERLQEAEGSPSGDDNDLSGLTLRLEALRASEGAQEAFEDWRYWDQVLSLLAPTGLRHTATIAALKKLNPKIEQIAKIIFPGREVYLRGEGGKIEFIMDGMGYEALSWNRDPNSFALRVQIMFQILEAKRIGEGAFVIIDRFDTLEMDHKNGIYNALIHFGVPALIGQMMNKKPDGDALRGADVGRTYWINDGVVEAV